MNRAATILAAFVVWAASSGLLFFICVFSVNEAIISAAIIISGVALIGSTIAFASKHEKLGLFFAAAPAVVIAGLMVMFAVVSYTQYYR